jgi:hypothetical protein
MMFGFVLTKNEHKNAVTVGLNTEKQQNPIEKQQS